MYRTRSSTAVFVSLSNLLKREYFYQPTVISTDCGSVDFELSMVRWNAKIPFDLWGPFQLQQGRWPWLRRNAALSRESGLNRVHYFWSCIINAIQPSSKRSSILQTDRSRLCSGARASTCRRTRSEIRSVIMGTFWSTNDLRQRRNRKFLAGEQGCFIERTILACVTCHRS